MYLSLDGIVKEINDVAKLGGIPSKIIMDQITWETCVGTLTQSGMLHMALDFEEKEVEQEEKGSWIVALFPELKDNKKAIAELYFKPIPGTWLSNVTGET